MNKKEKANVWRGLLFEVLFVIWTVLIQTVDVRPLGQNGTNIGFATVNVWFHSMSGVHMWIYNVTDWLGLVPIVVCISFGILGFIQLIKRRSLLKVDKDIIILGIYYVIVIMAYLLFETIPINYRPILINGFMEASYPSSTTLLVMSVMPTLVWQIDRRVKKDYIKKAVRISSITFTLFMVIGRLLAGVHWLTDIIGSVLLSIGLFLLYMGCARCITNSNNVGGDRNGIS